MLLTIVCFNTLYRAATEHSNKVGLFYGCLPSTNTHYEITTLAVIAVKDCKENKRIGNKYSNEKLHRHHILFRQISVKRMLLN